MFFLVMYNLSPIQKGIQAGHAALEYARSVELKSFSQRTEDEYHDFIDNWKTWIILDGGGSKQVEEAAAALKVFQVPFAAFREPDLNDSMSAIAFVLPDYVYDRDHPSHGDSSRDVMIRQWMDNFYLAR